MVLYFYAGKEFFGRIADVKKIQTLDSREYEVKSMNLQ